jgi:hypothetical protein
MISLRRAGGGDPIMVDMIDDGIGEWSEHRRKLRPQLGSAPRNQRLAVSTAGALMVMGGDYRSSDFAVTEDGGIRRIVHVPAGMTIESDRLPTAPMVVSNSRATSPALGRLPKRRFDILASG